MAAEDALQQRVKWLEEERRKDHSLLLALQERLVALEGDYRGVTEQIKGLSAGLARVSASLGRMDALEGALARVEQESAERDEVLEDRMVTRLRESESTFREDMEALRRYVSEAHRKLEGITALERQLAQHVKEFQTLQESIAAVENRLEGVEGVEEDRKRAIHLLQEAQTRNSKRLVDLQGEVLAFRKRLDEQHAQGEVFGETLRKLESRLQDLAAAETRRKQEQKDFLEAQNRRWLAWERTWKAWETRFQTLETLSQQVEERLRAWDDLQREVKRAQQQFEGMSERLERRIKEITEVQRLAEERFRQEWAAFKADDQKRWANYLLSQDERGQEIDRRLERMNEQLVTLQDGLQALDDLVSVSDEQVRKRLQNLLALAQEWMSEYDRLVGAVKK